MVERTLDSLRGLCVESLVVTLHLSCWMSDGVWGNRTMEVEQPSVLRRCAGENLVTGLSIVGAP